MGKAAWSSIALYRPEDGPRVLPGYIPPVSRVRIPVLGVNPRFLEIIRSRSATPVRYMIENYPRDVAGSVNEVVVVKKPSNLGARFAVLIKLAPT